MQAKDIMTADPACVTPDTTLERAATLMAERDCGAILVVDRSFGQACRGDRDRSRHRLPLVAGEHPANQTVASVMSSPVATVTLETLVQRCCGLIQDVNSARRSH